MKLISSALAAIVLGLGLLSIHLHFELDTERTRAGIKQSDCPAAPVIELESADLPLPSSNSGLRPPERESSSSPVKSAQARAANVADDVIPTARSDFNRRRFDTEQRRMYRGLALELNLSSESEGQLLNLLRHQSILQMEALRNSSGDLAKSRLALSELNQRNEAELMRLLGDKYLAFDDYRKSLGERMQIEQAALQLEAADVPLRDNQRRQMLDVMLDERERTPQPIWTPGVAPYENVAKMQQWQEDYERRVLGRLSGILAYDQLTQYNVYRKLQSALRRQHQEFEHASAAARM